MSLPDGAWRAGAREYNAGRRRTERRPRTFPMRRAALLGQPADFTEACGELQQANATAGLVTPGKGREDRCRFLDD
ncbi:MAG: hypothetical protein ACYC6L_01450 [Anaerolineae bacterium]